MKVLGLVRDLFFRSKIDGAAAAVGGVEIVYASTVEVARARAAEHAPALILTDLSDENFPPREVNRQISAAAPAAKLIGFASHVDLKSMKAAKEAGFERVLSRSEFTAQLPSLLRTP